MSGQSYEGAKLTKRNRLILKTYLDITTLSKTLSRKSLKTNYYYIRHVYLLSKNQ